MSTTDPIFGRLPRWWVSSGRWAKMKPSDLAVVGVLVVHADRQNIAWPSLETIAELAGVHRTIVIRSIKRLAALSVVEVVQGGGRGHSNRYRIITNSSHTTTVSSEKTVATRLPKNRETVVTRHRNSSRIVRETVVARLPEHKKEQKKNRAQAAPAAGAGAPTKGAQPKGRGRRRDEVFEAVAESCGLALDGLTKSARGQLNRAANELREVGAEPMEIRQRAAVYAERYRGATLTPTALAKHWPQLGGNGHTPTEKTIDPALLEIEP